MATTYEPIATTTLGTDTATISLSSIPATFTDLRLVITGRTNPAADPVIRFNSDSGSNYSVTRIKANGSTALSNRVTSQTGIEYSYSDVGPYTQPTSTIIDLFSYAGATFKTALIELNADANGANGLTRCVSLWRDTDAIDTIGITAATWVAGTTFSLYGILKA